MQERVYLGSVIIKTVFQRCSQCSYENTFIAAQFPKDCFYKKDYLVFNNYKNLLLFGKFFFQKSMGDFTKIRGLGQIREKS